MKPRRWKKTKGAPFYRYDGKSGMSFIFRSPGPVRLWAWCVWAAGPVEVGGVEQSRARARGRANAELDKVERPQ